MRFDYQDFDPAKQHLVIAHMKDASVVIVRSSNSGGAPLYVPNQRKRALPRGRRMTTTRRMVSTTGGALGGAPEPKPFDGGGYLGAKYPESKDFSSERETGVEPATPSLGSLCSTN